MTDSKRVIYKMRVDRIIDHTPSVRELVLSTREPAKFQFQAGQFVMLRVPAEPKPLLRAYSIASDAKIETGFKLIFKWVEGGAASKYVWGLKGDEELSFTGPWGRVLFKEPPTEQVVFINTGSGISQHMSYLLTHGEKYPDRRYRLLFGVRNENEIYYRNELEELKSRLPDFHYEFILSRPSETWKGKKGYVQHFIKEFDYLKIPTSFYLCGNSGMIKDIKHQLLEIDGLDKSSLMTEAFD